MHLQKVQDAFYGKQYNLQTNPFRSPKESLSRFGYKEFI